MMAGLQSTWIELGGDSDVVRGMSLAPNQTRHGATQACRLGRKDDSGMETYFEQSCGIGRRHAR